MSRSEFILHLGGWIDGKIYTHNYEVGDADWREEDWYLLSGSCFKVIVRGEKCREVYRLLLSFAGVLHSYCDRCGEELDLDLEHSFELLIRPSRDWKERNEQEEDPYICYVPVGERVFDLHMWIYDSIILLATKPKFCEQVDRNCNPQILQYFNN